MIIKKATYRQIGIQSDNMSLFNDKYNAFLAEFGQGRKMVLSTSENNKVSSRI